MSRRREPSGAGRFPVRLGSPDLPYSVTASYGANAYQNNHPSDGTMHELTITPQGHLFVRETVLDTPHQEPSKALLDAYAESAARGMLYSATDETAAVLPPAFEFARSFARLYLTTLCKAATGEPGKPLPELPPPTAELEQKILQAPPMTGLGGFGGCGAPGGAAPAAVPWVPAFCASICMCC